MPWMARLPRGVFVALLAALAGCGLLAPLDGLTGNDAGGGLSPVRDATSPGSDAADDTTDDVSAAPDAATDAPDVAPVDAPATDADAFPVDAPPESADAPSEAADAPSDAAQETGTVAPIAFVQVASATSSATTGSISATYPVAQTAGDLDVVAIGWNDTTSTILAVTDSAGNAYALAIGPTRLGADLSQSLYYAKNIAAAKASANTVTVAFAEAAETVDLRIVEYSGLSTTAPLDVTASGSGNDSGPAATAAVTTTSAHELLFAAGMTTEVYSGAGTGFASRIITSEGDIVEDRVVSTTGSYSAMADLGESSEWLLQMATFRQ